MAGQAVYADDLIDGEAAEVGDAGGQNSDMDIMDGSPSNRALLMDTDMSAAAVAKDETGKLVHNSSLLPRDIESLEAVISPDEAATSLQTMRKSTRQRTQVEGGAPGGKGQPSSSGDTGAEPVHREDVDMGANSGKELSQDPGCSLEETPVSGGLAGVEVRSTEARQTCTSKDKKDVDKDFDAAAAAAILLKKQALKDEFNKGILDGNELSVDFDNFPYYLR